MTVMAFTDLRLAGDVIDLILSLEDRANGALGLMLCDEHHRGLQPIVLNDVPDTGEIVDNGRFDWIVENIQLASSDERPPTPTTIRDGLYQWPM